MGRRFSQTFGADQEIWLRAMPYARVTPAKVEDTLQGAGV